jgi:tetraacyldisaccharide 4'-kinase
LREPLTGLTRADCVVITRSDQSNNLDTLRDEIRGLTENAPIFQSTMRIKNLPETIPTPVAAFCGVGNPQSFFNLIPHEIVLQKTFPDHHRYSQTDVDSLIEAATRAGADSLITTAKDAVKLKSLLFSLPCFVLEIEPRIENEAELARLVLTAAKA